MKESRDHSNRLSIDLTDPENALRLEDYANCILENFDAKITNKVEGLDQTYWDIDIRGTKVVLHHETFDGISIFIQDSANDNLLREIAAKLIIRQK